MRGGLAILEGALNLRPAPLLARLLLVGLAAGVVTCVSMVGPWRVVGAALLGLLGFPLLATVAPLLLGGGRMETQREGILVRLSPPVVWRGAMAGMDFGLLYLVEALWGELCGGVYWLGSWLAMRVMEKGALAPLFEASARTKSTPGAIWCAILCALAFAPFALPYLSREAMVALRATQGAALLALLEARQVAMRRWEPNYFQ